MKHKNIFLVFFVFLFFSTISIAQTQYMKIETKDGNVIKHNVYGIKNVTWIPATPKPPQPQTYKLNGVEYKMILVEGGPNGDFYMMQTELEPNSTLIINGVDMGKLNYDDRTTERSIALTIPELNAMINKIKEETGWTFTLPTKEEWVYAAKGGNKSKGYTYSGSNNIDDVAWYKNNCTLLQPIAQKQPNELGLYDMSGNYAEVTYDTSRNTLSLTGDLYGGSWKRDAANCSSSSMYAANNSSGRYTKNGVITCYNTIDLREETVRLIYYVNQ